MSRIQNMTGRPGVNGDVSTAEMQSCLQMEMLRSDPGTVASDDGRKDYLIERDGESYAGAHLLIDLYDAPRLDDIGYIEDVLRDCVVAAGATLLHIHLHHFTPNGGVSGVAVLAESHISIHTWPEHKFAALDVFMCGGADPHKAVDVLSAAFHPARVRVDERLRGAGL